MVPFRGKVHAVSRPLVLVSRPSLTVCGPLPAPPSFWPKQPSISSCPWALTVGTEPEPVQQPCACWTHWFGPLKSSFCHPISSSHQHAVSLESQIWCAAGNRKKFVHTQVDLPSYRSYWLSFSLYVDIALCSRICYLSSKISRIFLNTIGGLCGSVNKCSSTVQWPRSLQWMWLLLVESLAHGGFSSDPMLFPFFTDAV